MIELTRMISQAKEKSWRHQRDRMRARGLVRRHKIKDWLLNLPRNYRVREEVQNQIKGSIS